VDNPPQPPRCGRRSSNRRLDQIEPQLDDRALDDFVAEPDELLALLFFSAGLLSALSPPLGLVSLLPEPEPEPESPELESPEPEDDESELADFDEESESDELLEEEREAEPLRESLL